MQDSFDGDRFTAGVWNRPQQVPGRRTRDEGNLPSRRDRVGIHPVSFDGLEESDGLRAIATISPRLSISTAEERWLNRAPRIHYIARSIPKKLAPVLSSRRRGPAIRWAHRATEEL
jgi:hypothetical protein